MSRGGGKLRTLAVCAGAYMVITSINGNEEKDPGSTGRTAGAAVKVVNDVTAQATPQVAAFANNVVTLGAELAGTAFSGLGQVGGAVGQVDGGAPAAEGPTRDYNKDGS